MAVDLRLPTCGVRSWRASDVDSLVEHANSRRIASNMRDRFPHPYGKADGEAFLVEAREMDPETFFAITVDDRAVGGIGFVLQTDVDRVSAEVGYWLGETFWGRGMTTDALRAVTAYAAQTHALARLYAVPFAHNTASCRVLEKAGYVLEGRLRRSAIKNGIVVDQLQYAFLVPWE